ncbi:hypothetical protein [Nostoc sp.]|uniref:hypothetical protein n=1 Tax=Nostoc sp. TaxID=1180 RepID=UPI002FFC7FBC
MKLSEYAFLFTQWFGDRATESKGDRFILVLMKLNVCIMLIAILAMSTWSNIS